MSQKISRAATAKRPGRPENFLPKDPDAPPRKPRIQRLASASTQERWKRVLDRIQDENMTVRESIALESHPDGRPLSIKAWEQWRLFYPEFRSLLEERNVKVGRSRPTAIVRKLDFPTFRKRILGRDTPEHQLEWQRAIEEPDNDHLIIISFPESGKTSMLRDYCVWRIYQDTEIRIAYGSRTRNHSKKQVQAIAGVLEENRELRRLAGHFKPEGRGRPWAADHFMVAQRSFELGMDESDYTMVAIGADSQIMGSRIDLFPIDDPDDVNLGNAEREDIVDWILQAAETRLGVGGKMVVLLNRHGEQDVASRLLARAKEEPDIWKVFIQSAVLKEPEEAGGPVVRWPEKFGAASRTSKHWTMSRAWQFFDRKRRVMGARRFNLVYQSRVDSGEDKDFPDHLVEAAFVRGAEYEWGKIPANSIVVCTQDPATAGGAATLAYAVLPNGQRLVCDVLWGTKRRTPGLIDWVREFGIYRPRYWGIEGQGPFATYVENSELLSVIASQRDHRGRQSELTVLHTNQNKVSGDFALSALASLFVSGQIIFPSRRPEDRERLDVLRHQLVTYHPDSEEPYDAVVALWLAERIIRRHGLDKGFEAGTTRIRALSNPYGTQRFANNAAWSPKTLERASLSAGRF